MRDENYVEVNGITFVPKEKFGCAGCEMINTPNMCEELHCWAGERLDNRSVIWVRAEKQEPASDRIAALEARVTALEDLSKDLSHFALSSFFKP